MNDDLDTLLDRAALVARHRDHVTAAARPRVLILPSTAPPSPGRSRCGGRPDLPEGTPWPEHPLGAYTFVAQINFAEVDGVDLGLPAQGLLSLFILEDEDGEVDWNHPDYLHALFFHGTPKRLTRPDPPAGTDTSTPLTVRFVRDMDVPHGPQRDLQWPHPDLPRALHRWWTVDLGHGPPVLGQLLGYPPASTLAYDPTPEGGWLPLLTLASREDLDWWWHGGDYLHLFVQRELLATESLDGLRAVTG